MPDALLVGRERERALLDECLGLLVQGQGGLVLISGEAGIGKSALARQLILAAGQRDALILAGHCYDLTSTPPYGPWFEVFERYPAAGNLPPVPAILERGAEIDSQSAWFDAVGSFFQAVSSARPLLLLLEDLHWSDPGSLETLRYLARHPSIPALFVATFRDDEVPPEHPLFHLLPPLVREAGAERIDLRRLERVAVGEMIDERYTLDANAKERLLAYLDQHGDGNPLYIEELLRALEAERVLRRDGESWALDERVGIGVPLLLRQLIESRVSRLGPDTRDALTLASVIGEEVPVDLWLAMSAAGDEELSAAMLRAINAHLLVEQPGGERLRFSHALVREALYLGLSPLRRRALHLQAADELLKMPHADPDTVAFHFQQAGDPRAFEWLLRAGLRARRSAAWLSAAERFKRAASLIADDPERGRERGWLLYYAAYLDRFSERDDILADVDEAVRLAVAAGDRVLSAYVHFHRAVVRAILGDIRRGLLDFEEATREWSLLPKGYRESSDDKEELEFVQSLVLGQVPPPLDRCALETDKGSAFPAQGVHLNWLAMAGRYREAIQLGEWYLAELAAGFGDEHLRLRGTLSGLLGLAQAYAASGRPADARRLFGLAHQGFARRGEHVMVDATACHELILAMTPYHADLVATRRQLIQRGIDAWERSTGVTTVSAEVPESALASAMLDGHWAELRRMADEDRLILGTSNERQLAMACFADLFRYQGELGRTWEQIRALHPDGPATEPGDSHFPYALAAQRVAAGIALDAGDYDAARDWIEANERWLAWSGSVLGQSELRLLRAQLAWKLGDSGLARREALGALERASEPRQPLALLAAHRFLGQIDTDEDRYSEAAQRLNQSLRLADACEVPFERARTLLELAALRVATGEVDAARPLLAEAREICEALGAIPALARADEMQKRLDEPQGRTSFPVGLSPREVEVVRLVARGLTNNEVAAELYISPRTVSQHLRSVYNKLGVTSRAAAVAFFAEHDLI